MRKKAVRKTRSPLKVAPLHNPGQSLDYQIQDLLSDKIYPWVLVPLLFGLITLNQWIWYLNPLKVPPYPGIVLTVIAFVVAALRLRKYFRELKNLRQGRDGERVVGQMLEDLRAEDCRVIHDVVTDVFNIDHIIVGPKGIFVVETKTWSKPAMGETIVQFDGESILVNGFEPERNPVVQVRYIAKWLQEFLIERTGKSLFIHPIVVFPGWYIKASKKAQSSGVWVLNEKGIAPFIQGVSKQHLTPDQVELVARQLSLYMRAKEQRGA